MIGCLTGVIHSKNPPLIVLDVHGVGYEVWVPLSTFYHLPELRQPLTLLTHFHVREDVQVLYGFREETERSLFRALIKITGVGPKMALTILSNMDAGTFMQCVEHREIDFLTKLPGVGKKTAERLIIEMSGKMKGISKTSGVKPQILPSFMEEAVEALVSLGYKTQEAIQAVSKVGDETLGTAEIIRRALQSFAKGHTHLG
jgi:Holliday junction DNA helicase RuvA